MNDAGPVDRVHGAGQGFDQLGGPPRRLRPVAGVAVEAAAVRVLHHEIVPAFMLADFKDLHDVGVLQAGDGLDLGAEAGQLVRARLRAGQDHLQRDQPTEAQLARLVDDAHAAPAQFPQQLVTGHGRPARRQGDGPPRIGSGRFRGRRPRHRRRPAFVGRQHRVHGAQGVDLAPQRFQQLGAIAAQLLGRDGAPFAAQLFPAQQQLMKAAVAGCGVGHQSSGISPCRAS